MRGSCTRLWHLCGFDDHQPYAVFEYVEGQHVEHPNERQREALIRAVAQLHLLTRRYRPAYARYRWNYSVALCEELATEAAHKIGSADAAAKLAWYREQLAGLTLPICLPKGICHCDFHYSNVLYRGDEIAALLDFDDANRTYLALDVAFLAEPFAPAFQWDTWQQFGPDDNVLDFTELRWVVAMYQRYRPLTRAEQKYLFDVVKLSILIDCLWYFERGAADDFYERRKIGHLDRLGRQAFREALFGAAGQQ